MNISGIITTSFAHPSRTPGSPQGILFSVLEYDEIIRVAPGLINAMAASRGSTQRVVPVIVDNYRCYLSQRLVIVPNYLYNRLLSMSPGVNIGGNFGRSIPFGSIEAACIPYSRRDSGMDRAIGITTDILYSTVRSDVTVEEDQIQSSIREEMALTLDRIDSMRTREPSASRVETSDVVVAALIERFNRIDNGVTERDIIGEVTPDTGNTEIAAEWEAQHPLEDIAMTVVLDEPIVTTTDTITAQPMDYTIGIDYGTQMGAEAVLTTTAPRRIPIYGTAYPTATATAGAGA